MSNQNASYPAQKKSVFLILCNYGSLHIVFASTGGLDWLLEVDLLPDMFFFLSFCHHRIRQSCLSNSDGFLSLWKTKIPMKSLVCISSLFWLWCVFFALVFGWRALLTLFCFYFSHWLCSHWKWPVWWSYQALLITATGQLCWDWSKHNYNVYLVVKLCCPIIKLHNESFWPCCALFISCHYSK